MLRACSARGTPLQVILHDALRRRRKIASNLSHPGRKVAKQSLQRQLADVDPLIKSHVAGSALLSIQHELKVPKSHNIKKLSRFMVHLQGFEPGTH